MLTRIKRKPKENQFYSILCYLQDSNGTIILFIHISNKLVLFNLFVGFDEEATFTLSARGQFKLIHENFDYVKMSVSQTGITKWRCGKNQSFPHLKCKAKAETIEVGQIQKVKIIGTHTHPFRMKDNRKRRIKIKNNIKNQNKIKK